MRRFIINKMKALVLAGGLNGEISLCEEGF